jgi:hypothetical protein
MRIAADSASADGSVPIEIEIGEATGAKVEERRDARETFGDLERDSAHVAERTRR